MRKIIIAVPLTVAALCVAITVCVKYDDWFVYRSARRPLAYLMKDPSSTIFRNERFVDYDWYCGEVDAKNEMGAYTGFKRFISGRLSNVIYLEGTGMLGKESTDELLLVMDKKIAYLESFKTIREHSPGARMISETEQYAQARRQVFEDHWKALCN